MESKANPVFEIVPALSKIVLIFKNKKQLILGRAQLIC